MSRSTTENTKNTEERFRLLYELSAINSDDIQNQLDEIVKTATQIFDLDIGIISQVEGNSYKIVSCYHPEQALQNEQAFDRGITYCDITLASNEPVAIHHMGRSQYAQHPCYSTFQIEAYIGIPVTYNDRVFGTLNFSSPSPRMQPFSEDDKQMIRIMGSWVSNILKTRENVFTLKQRNQQYERLIENTQACLYIHDLQGTILQVNSQLCQEIGYEEHELVGLNLKDFIYSSQTVDAYLSELRKNGKAEGSFPCISKHKTVQHLSYKNITEGESVLGFSQNITQRVITEQALVESESNLREAQALARLGSWTYDIFDDKISWTDEIFRIFERDPAESEPQIEDYLTLIHQEDRVELEEAIKEAIENGKAYTNDHRLLINGQVKYLHAIGRPQYDQRGNVIQLIGTLQDVTKSIKANQELVKAKESAEAAARIKQEFLANMSHEIRTPMNAILGFARLMLKSELTTDQQEYMQAVYGSAETLLVVINDILDFSKIEAGKLPIVPLHFDLKKLLDGIQKLFSVKVEEQNVRLVFDTDEHLPDALVGDPIRINQILNNLVNNAVKFTEKGSVEVTTRIASQTDRSYQVEIAIKDTGIGIATEKLEHIFGSFEQAQGDITRRYGGTGLGLSIVKKLVELMQGEIWVESTEGEGSVFTVRLPFEKGDVQKVCIDGVEVNEMASLAELKGTKVLLTEDNRNNQILAKKYLSEVGCEVDIADNGEVAVAMVQQKIYDVILMDIQMPIMDGLEATETIQALDIEHCPIIAMTAHALKSEENKYLSIGMSDYLSKPFKPDVLYAKLLKALKKADEATASLEESKIEQGLEGNEIDFESFEMMASGDEKFMRDMIQTFLQDVPDFLKEMSIALSLQDWKWLRQTAHNMKSSVFFLGMPKTIERLNELDEGDLQQMEFEAVEKYCQQVTNTCHQAIEMLQEKASQF
ncbi:MAG: ATP-binding protein [Bacteroidota bacterium]